MKVVKSVQLFFQEGNSDKVYDVSIVEETPSAFTVRVEWGRRDGPLQAGTKAVKVPLAKAEAEFQKVVREKTKKGYEERSGTVQPAAVAPPVGQGSGSKAGVGGRAKVGPGAQLLNACADDDLERLLASKDHVAQQKLDGARVLVHVKDDLILATNRSGEATDLADPILEAFQDLVPGTILDGELVGETYHAFDLLQHGTEDVRALGYLERYRGLDVVVEQIASSVELVALAVTERDKRALFARLEAERAEGIVFKRRDAPYVTGRPASGGTQLKYKFTKTADVAIVANAGNAYAMVVLDGDAERPIGKVFAGTTSASRAELDRLLAAGERPVAEVEYLYATDDDQLFQPVFRRLRDDKTPQECLLAQLVRTNRRVVT